MHDDERIISQVLSGNTAAYRLLVSRHERSVFGFVTNLVRNAADMDDLAQEVFVAAFTHLDSFDPKRAKFSTWLLTIARNRCCNFLKRRSQTPRVLGDPVSDAGSPALDVVVSETWSRLDAALDRLSLEQRTAFVLAEIQDMPLAEIAVIEGVPLGTVKSRLSRAKENLRHALKDLQPGGAESPQPASQRGAR